MDCCKTIALGAEYDGDIWSGFWARPGIINFEPLSLGMVVTASGTGSYKKMTHEEILKILEECK